MERGEGEGVELDTTLVLHIHGSQAWEQQKQLEILAILMHG